MRPDDWQKLSPLLDQALELTGTEQAAFVAKVSADDPRLGRELASLLEQRSPADLFDIPPPRALDDLRALAAGADADSDPTAQVGALPRQAGRYVIEGEIARGGMGIVLRALDEEMGRRLAVKILSARARRHAGAERRFLREARITARLQHPGIPPIHELGRLDDGAPFFAMKLIEGRTLSALLAASPRPADEPHFIAVFEQICETLAFAHSRRIVHRDLKPSNVMVGAFGEVQVMDWGLAKPLDGTETDGASGAPSGDESTWISQAGDITGTPAFMAPEQARGESDAIDERCDVFGLGGILCAILTGRAPFAGRADAVRTAAAGDLSDAYSRLDACGADAELIALAKKCLAPWPEDRYANGTEVAAAVTAYREGVRERLKQAELARERAQVQAREERRRRRLAFILAASLAILALGAAAAGVWYLNFKAQRDARARNLNDLVQRSLDAAEAERRDLNERLLEPAKVHLLLSDLAAWKRSLDRAKASGQQARGLAGSDPELLDSATHERLNALTEALAADDKDVAFVRELDGIRLKVFEPPAGAPAALRRAGKSLLAAWQEEYEALFQRQGLAIETEDPGALAGRLARSNVRFVMAAALDDWARLALNDTLDGAKVKRLLDLARRIDSDPWRDRFRQWSVWSSRAELEKALADLKPERQPPQILGVVAELERYHGIDPRPLFHKALLHYAGDFWLSYQLGNAADRSRSYDEAAAAYRAALAVRPKSYHTLNNLGAALGKKGDLTGAAEAIAEALRHNPDFSGAHANLGKVRYERGDRRGAIVHYRAALARDDADPIVHNNLAAALSLIDEPEEALKHVDLAVKAAPRFAEAFNNRGVILAQLGRYDDALEAMSKARELEPDEARAGLIARYRQIIQLRKRESAPPVEKAQLEKGLAGRLDADLPLDVFMTQPAYRASHLVSLDAGRHYQIDLTGDFDTYLRIEDRRYNVLLFNDDVRPPDALDSRLIFAPAKTDVYRLVVTSFKTKTTGAYQLRLREVVPLGPATVFRGRLDRSDKADTKGRLYQWHDVTLERDRPYTIILESRDFDTRVRLTDGTRKQAYAENEMMRPGQPRLSRLDFTSDRTAGFSVLVSTARAGVTGDYVLTVQGYEAK